MAGKRKPPPTHEEIAKAQWPWLSELGTVWSEEDAVVTCWACGFGIDGEVFTEKAHIVPHSEGGENVPSNYLLLCSGCHRGHPDGASFEDQVDWLANHPSWANPAIICSRYPQFGSWWLGWLNSLSKEDLETVTSNFDIEAFKGAYKRGASKSASTKTETVRANAGVEMKRYLMSLLKGEKNES